MVKERVKDFLKEIGLPVTRFAKCIGLSPDAVRQWLADDLNLKQSNIEKIDKWLKQFNR